MQPSEARDAIHCVGGNDGNVSSRGAHAQDGPGPSGTWLKRDGPVYAIRPCYGSSCQPVTASSFLSLGSPAVREGVWQRARSAVGPGASVDGLSACYPWVGYHLTLTPSGALSNYKRASSTPAWRHGASRVLHHERARSPLSTASGATPAQSQSAASDVTRADDDPAVVARNCACRCSATTCPIAQSTPTSSRATAVTASGLGLPRSTSRQ